jgi:hypothetical protein
MYRRLHLPAAIPSEFILAQRHCQETGKWGTAVGPGCLSLLPYQAGPDDSLSRALRGRPPLVHDNDPLRQICQESTSKEVGGERVELPTFCV